MKSRSKEATDRGNKLGALVRVGGVALKCRLLKESI